MRAISLGNALLGEKYASWVVGISLGIGFLVVLNQLRIPYYLFYPRTTQTVLISPLYDYYVFLVSTISVPWSIALFRGRISLPVCVGTISVWAISFILAIVNEPFAASIVYVIALCASVLVVFRSDGRRDKLMEILPSALTTLVLVEWASICFFVAAAINPHRTVASIGMLSEALEANLTFFLYPVAIPIMLLLLLAWVWVPLIPRLSRQKSHLVVRYRPSPPKPDLRMIVLALDLFAMLSLILFFYPYLGGQTWVVGEDAFLTYIDPAKVFVGVAPSQAFNTSAWHGVYVLFLYLIHLATGLSVEWIVKYVPFVLAFCTASAALFVALRGGWNFQLAVLTALSTLLWIPTTIGIYVDVQANWVALLFWMIFLAIYFASSQPKPITYGLLAVLSLLILLVHPWTWGVFATTLLITTLISRGSGWSKHSLRTLIATFGLALPIGVFAYSFSPSLRLDLTSTVQLYISGPINPAGLLMFGAALTNMFANEGPILSPALLLLSLVGAYALSKRRGIATNYLLAWVATWFVGSVLVAPSGLNATNPALSETGLWRMLYISPLPFLLALGMDRCLSISKHPLAASTPASILSRTVPVLSMAPFLLVGVGLYLFTDPNLRLLLVVAALVLALFLIVRLPNYRTLDALIVTALVLVLFNAAFRTLYPLVLDPHNIFSSVATGPTGPPGR